MTKHLSPKRGRPTRYKPEFIEQAAKLCALGATDADMASFFKITVTTLNNWKRSHPDFLASIKDAKTEADEQVERSLFERATGYEHPAVKIAINAVGEVTEVPYTEHYPPDTTAMIFWLKNRQPKLWRDVTRQEHTGADGEPVSITFKAVYPKLDEK